MLKYQTSLTCGQLSWSIRNLSNYPIKRKLYLLCWLVYWLYHTALFSYSLQRKHDFIYPSSTPSLPCTKFLLTRGWDRLLINVSHDWLMVSNGNRNRLYPRLPKRSVLKAVAQSSKCFWNGNFFPVKFWRETMLKAIQRISSLGVNSTIGKRGCRGKWTGGLPLLFRARLILSDIYSSCSGPP